MKICGMQQTPSAKSIRELNEVIGFRGSSEVFSLQVESTDGKNRSALQAKLSFLVAVHCIAGKLQACLLLWLDESTWF
jgi:hypothetical protein